MAGTVKAARIESPSARARLKSGRQPHWKAIVEGRVHLGYQRWKGEADGRWVLRRYIGNNKYRTATLGRADDNAPANGGSILTYQQAEAKARATRGRVVGARQWRAWRRARAGKRSHVQHSREAFELRVKARTGGAFA